MGYFRAVLASGEASPRVLALTGDIIELSPASYSAWRHRRVCLGLGTAPGPSTAAMPPPSRDELRRELAFVTRIALATPKNYQLWHHRRAVVDALDEGREELAFTSTFIAEEGKNYHAWAHRQWALGRWGAWEGDGTHEGGELGFVTALLALDVRNNSAWNHRWLVVTRGGGRPCGRREVARNAAGMRRAPCVLDDDTVAAELEFTCALLKVVGRNEAAWAYARALVAAARTPRRRFLAAWPELTALAAALRTRAEPGVNPFASGLLADASEEEAEAGGEGAPAAAQRALALLRECAEADPVRAQYWAARMGPGSPWMGGPAQQCGSAAPG
jgi:protein farnesyltransferase/geranylgeranyltransferase type-1 subunit alpha